jgi:hypothetical protein
MLELLVSRATDYFPAPSKIVDLVKRQVVLILTCGFTKLFLQNVLKVNAQYFVSVLVSSVELPSDFALNLTLLVCTKNRFRPEVHFFRLTCRVAKYFGS